MSALLRTLLAIATVTILTACGLTKGKEIASKSVETFHQQFNDSKITEIYSAATPDFKTSAKEADFMKFIQAVRGKLGAYKSGTQSNWRVNTFNGTTNVILVYNSEFEQGSGVEMFTFILSGKNATLQSYNINSQKLITD